MADSATLHSLIELADARKQKAGQAFAQAAAAHAQARERLVLIQNYRSEYETRLREQAGTGIDGTRVVNYARFIQQLSDALEQQQREVERCARHLQAMREDFFAEERKLKSFEILAEREQQRVAGAEARRVQKQIDEFANRKSFGSPTGFMP
ncbi:hypothetical protein GCM10023144_44270 [Pigmentiphaga soli]|uniref:Flagellar FliJ protein n=1 Tax=Pigmentiphaga soli TaxID=1007095 RepID=A0ABP8HPN6_9BURK